LATKQIKGFRGFFMQALVEIHNYGRVLICFLLQFDF
jgi:hypothetical protein